MIAKNKYLEKIASKSDDHLAIGIGGGLGAIAASHVAAVGGNLGILGELDKTHAIDKSSIRKILRKNRDLNVTFSSTKAFGGNKEAGRAYKDIMGAAGPNFSNDNNRKSIHKLFSGKSILDYIPGVKDERARVANALKTPMKRSYIHLADTKNINIAMHELGHARDYKNAHTGLGKAKMYVDGASRIASRLGVGYVAGGAMLANDKTKKHAWLAPLVTAAPMLRSEMAANYHGYNMLKSVATGAMKRKFIGTAAKNLIGYAAGPLAGSAVLAAVGRHKDKDK